jgi:hypothetical protein
MKLSMIYGTEMEVLKEIEKLKVLGITDVLIQPHQEDDQLDRLHKMTKTLTDGLKNASL